jgi:DNA-binding transcriptional LysR family regulator
VADPRRGRRAGRIEPAIWSSSGETLRQLALDGAGIVCLSDFMTAQDREAGRLVQVLTRHTLDVDQPINAVYYRNTAISSRIASFVDYLIDALRGGSGTGSEAPARRKAAWMGPL